MDMNAPAMRDVMDAAAPLRTGDKEAARAQLLALWETSSAEGALIQTCGAAHLLADLETDLAGELEWDLKALETATGSREPEDLAPRPPVPETFLPSLHLSVAVGYRKTGKVEAARRHARICEARIGALLDDAYGNQVRAILGRLQASLRVA